MGWDGKALDNLLEQRGGQEILKQLVDEAVRVRKLQLSWTWSKRDENELTLLKTLKGRVPNDPYLKKVLYETDFTPPVQEKPKQVIRETAVPGSDIDKLRRLIDQGADVNAQFGSNCSCDRN